MIRIVVRVLGFLIAGVALAIAVAVAAIYAARFADHRETRSLPPAEDAWFPMNNPYPSGYMWIVVQRSTLGVQFRDYWCVERSMVDETLRFDPPRVLLWGHGDYTIIASGWPVPAFAAAGPYLMGPFEPMLSIPFTALVLPAHVLWRGLVIDSLVFAVALAAARLACHQIVRTWRLFHGRCPRCKYPLGPGGTCAECGLATSERPRP